MIFGARNFSWLGRPARAFAAQPLFRIRFGRSARAGRPSHVVLAVASLLLAVTGAAPTESLQPPEITAPATQSVRFATVDVRIDPKGRPLSAYQLEIVGDPQRVKLAGVEGGEHTAFRDPPYYDPAALNQNRIILAAFNTGSDLPKTAFRAARLHVQIAGDADPAFEVKLTVASTSDGSAAPGATASVTLSTAPAPTTEGAVP